MSKRLSTHQCHYLRLPVVVVSVLSWVFCIQCPCGRCWRHPAGHRFDFTNGLSGLSARGPVQRHGNHCRKAADRCRSTFPLAGKIHHWQRTRRMERTAGGGRHARLLVESHNPCRRMVSAGVVPQRCPLQWPWPCEHGRLWAEKVGNYLDKELAKPTQPTHVQTQTIKFEPMLESLKQYAVPEWFEDAKLGILGPTGAHKDRPTFPIRSIVDGMRE